MEKNIIELYSGYYYPVILIDSSSLKVVYKNKAAQAIKMKLRVGVHMKNYIDEKNLEILEALEAEDGKDQILELSIRPSRCVVRISEDMNRIILVFLDSLNLMQECSPETAEKIAEITTRYNEKKLLLIGKNDGSDTAKSQKIRMYFDRYVDNLMMDEAKRNFLQSYCDVMEFLHNLEAGISPALTKMGYQISFDMGNRDEIYMYWLNESDFLTLNFVLMSYALTRSIFGVLDVKFEVNRGALIYEFMPAAGLEEQGDNIDLELAKLIAKNNKLELNFHAAADSDNLIERKSEGKAQIAIRFMVESDAVVLQTTQKNNIINADIVAERAELELINLYNM